MSPLSLGIITMIVFILLGIAMFLVGKYCKKKSLKIGLATIIALFTFYTIIFSIDYNRVASLREPIFARKSGHMGSMTRYDGFGYKIGLEKNATTGYISQSQMTMFGVFIVRAVADTNDELNSTGTAEYLFSLKTSYIGDNSAVGRLLDALDIRAYGHYTFELITSQKPYILIINYSQIEAWGPISTELITEKSAILLALIDNADEIHWTLPNNNETHKITTNDLINKYGNIKDYGESAETLKSLLVKLGYYENKEDNPITMSISNLTNKGLTLKIINNTNNNYQYGMCFSLERKENDKWVAVKQIKDNCAFTMMAYSLKANQSVEMGYDWNVCYGKLPKGQYRITKDFDHVISSTESGQEFGKKHIISAEFII